MNYEICSDAKVNLTLRVHKKDFTGYHPLKSFFVRVPAVETLTLTLHQEDNVKDVVTLSPQLDRCNLVELLQRSRALVERPSIHVRLDKRMPTGSGLGAGSGNGAALWRWLYSRNWIDQQALALAGMDSYFLATDRHMAFVQGYGEKVGEELGPLGLVLTLHFQPWHASTAKLYGDLDQIDRQDQLDVAQDLEIVQRLRRKEKVGLLPNDFLSVLPNRQPVLTFFEQVEQRGAYGWGMSGSGSCLFALWDQSLRPIASDIQCDC